MADHNENSMKNYLLIGVAVLIVGLSVFVLFKIYNGGTTTPLGTATTTATFPGSGNVGNPSGVGGTGSGTVQQGTLLIATQSGTRITTNDFLSAAATVKDPINTGNYFLGYHQSEGMPDETATSNPPYVIEYSADSQFFNIKILQEPLGAVRSEAEQYLMESLNIPQVQLCQLNYMVSVPYWVNTVYAGKNLGFSFCQGATPLPN